MPVVFQGPISGEADFVMSGTSTLEVQSLDNTYTGETVVAAGNLIVNGDITSSPHATIETGGMLSGTGSLRALTVEDGGTLTTADQTWEGGGALEFDINDATGTAGTNWGLLAINGALDVTADDLHPFVFKITTFSGATPGDMANFVPGDHYMWLVASTTVGISGLNFNNVVFDTTGFSNAGPVYFSVSQIGNNLYLVAVPEPAEWGAVMGVALFGLAILRHRRRY